MAYWQWVRVGIFVQAHTMAVGYIIERGIKYGKMPLIKVVSEYALNVLTIFYCQMIGLFVT